MVSRSRFHHLSRRAAPDNFSLGSQVLPERFAREPGTPAIRQSMPFLRLMAKTQTAEHGFLEPGCGDKSARSRRSAGNDFPGRSS